MTLEEVKAKCNFTNVRLYDLQYKRNNMIAIKASALP